MFHISVHRVLFEFGPEQFHCGQSLFELRLGDGRRPVRAEAGHADQLVRDWRFRDHARPVDNLGFCPGLKVRTW